MDHDARYQDGKDGPLKKEIRDRIAAFRVRGSTLADIAEALGFSASFVGQLLNEAKPARVRTIRVPRIIEVLEAAERDLSAKAEDGARLSQTELPRGERDRQRSKSAAPKPTMFIASSSENKVIAYDVQQALEDDVYATVWPQGVFGLSRTNLDSLSQQLKASDFAVFVLVPDDVVSIRNSPKRAIRDNVIFELGLFIGHLGVERCFMVMPRGMEDLRLPTDLLGITVAEYNPQRPDNNLLASLGPAVNRIRKEVIRLGPSPHRSKGSG